MVDMADMVLEDTTARGRLMPRPYTISVVDTTEVTDTAEAMEVMDTEDTTERGTPRLRPVTTSVGDTMVDTDTGVTTVTRGRASHAISPKFSLELSVKC